MRQLEGERVGEGSTDPLVAMRLELSSSSRTQDAPVALSSASLLIAVKVRRLWLLRSYGWLSLHLSTIRTNTTVRARSVLVMLCRRPMRVA